MSSTQKRATRRNAGLAMLLMAPYLALFMHESLPKLRSLRPATPAELPDDLREVIKRSRHSLKLFEDTQRSVDDQLAYFDDILIPAHRDRFLGNTWFRPARRFETDLGLYKWGKRSCIGTTHGISLSMGMELNELLAGDKERMQEVSSGYGKYFGIIGAQLVSGASSFVSGMTGSPIRNLDRESWKLYGRIFPGVGDSAATGLLLNFACSIDFVQDVVPLDQAEESRQTVAKIRFLTLYQVVRSLEILLASDRADAVSDAWTNEANELIRRSEVAQMVGEAVRPFRNTLMHYGPDSRMDLSAMRIDEPLYAMTEQCFDGRGLAEFESDLAKALTTVQTFFRETAGSGRFDR
ncbi:MAG: hypothetical protein ACRDRH_02410 [Pseudonocardia sp.]